MSDPEVSTSQNSPHEGGASRAGEFVRLLSSCERRLYSYVLSLVGNLVDADDIVQETNLKLWEQFADYRPEADFGGWACTIAYYQVLSFRKRSHRRGLQLSSEFFEKVAAEILSRTDELDSRQHAIGYCLEKLSAADRDLVLRCYDGKSSIRQVAASIGRTLSATYQALWRVRGNLHRCIERRLKAQGA